MAAAAIAAAAISQNPALARDDPGFNEAIMDGPPATHTASLQAATRFSGPIQGSGLFVISPRY
ncbi:MAG: hypothetical protein CVT75_02140 [Alphaproteobacteria bacterium HGW-Alphaproteobacteria-14]|nr:MAG: hypothetical protein CVT75_02140 [Alphaproteobacteria bacterium HGW-Alphaproteobacteria-14]